MLSDSATRVQEHTTEKAERDIQRQTAGSFARHANAGPGEIGSRLADLEQEWDIERTLQTNFAIVNLLGLTLGTVVDRRWYLFSAGATWFMLQHSLQGWCPPLPAFRSAGVRTRREIDHERYALKAVRGDFRDISAFAGAPPRESARQALEAAER